MSLNNWLTFWMVLIALGLLGMIGLLLMIGGGAIRELKQTLEELRSPAEDSEEGAKEGAEVGAE